MKFTITLSIFLLAGIYLSPLSATCPTDEEVLEWVKQQHRKLPNEGAHLHTKEGEGWISYHVPDKNKFDLLIHRKHPKTKKPVRITAVTSNAAESRDSLCAYNLVYDASAYKSPSLVQPTELLTFTPNPCPSWAIVLDFVQKKQKPDIDDTLDAGAKGIWKVYETPNYKSQYTDFNSAVKFLNQNPLLSTEGRCAYNVGWPQSEIAVKESLTYGLPLLIFEKVSIP